VSASVSAAPADTLRPRSADGWGSGLAMALGAHLLLVGALALGVQWKMSNPEPVEAEVWAEVPTAAAPAVVPEPAPTPAPEPEPAPPPPAPPEPVKVQEPLPEPVPDVVVAKLSKAERKKQKHKEPVEVFESTPPKPSKKADKPPKVDKAERPEKPPAKAEPQPKTKPTDKPAVDNSAQASAEREAQRKANLARMMGDLGTMGSSAQSGGPTAAYGGRIKARIKPNIVFAETVSGNPTALVEVRCAADGRIISRRLLKSSGLTSWDEAVLRAVDRTEVLPANESGRVPPIIELEFKPNDF
jgi:colicin import membrane protein